MTLQANLTALTQRMANEAKALRTLLNGNLADLSTLSTSAKGSLVAAINELAAEIDTLAGGGVSINDGATGAGATWSSQKIVGELQALKAQILGPDVSAALDTLKEIGDAITANGNALGSLTTVLANRVRVDAAQGLTAAQQLQARQNIGAVAAADIGDTEVNLVTVFNTALAS